MPSRGWLFIYIRHQNQLFRRLIFSFLFALIFVVMSVVTAQLSFAQNFIINPASGYVFPTTVFPGSNVSVYYTVTNKTQSKRSGYTVRGLPNSVKQITNGSNCSNPINLDPKAQCLLQLDITNTVHSNFAICNGTSCTTAAVPLNVTLSSSPPFMVLAGSSTNTPVPLLFVMGRVV